MASAKLEIADIFRCYGDQWRQAHKGHMSLEQLQVMSAIEHCRTSALGGHVLLCPKCDEFEISYNSCRNRHCPKCQATAAKRWLEERQKDLLPIEYYHVVFTLPAVISEIAYQNKKVVYAMLFKTAAETLLTIAADSKHLGAHVGITMVLHTWGSAMPHHPHVHCIVTGGGLSGDEKQWITCRQGFFLPVRVLSRLFRRLFLEKLNDAYRNGALAFYGHLDSLERNDAFAQKTQSARTQEWVVYAKPPFAGPKAVLAYLSRYTHRVAIANSRLVNINENGVTFKWKDYRNKNHYRPKVMMLPISEFIRRFLLHVLPKGFQRIRHYGLLANAHRVENLSKARELLDIKVVRADEPQQQEESVESTYICPACKIPMIIIETFDSNHLPRAPPILSSVI